MVHGEFFRFEARGDYPMSTVVAETPAELAAQLWGRSDVAQVFRVTAETVKKWERDGKLPSAVRIGHKPFWPADVIRDLALRGGQAR